MPSVLLVTERFEALARMVRVGKGMPEQPMLLLPGNPEFTADAELAASVDALIDPLARLVAPAAQPLAAAASAR